MGFRVWGKLWVTVLDWLSAVVQLALTIGVTGCAMIVNVMYGPSRSSSSHRRHHHLHLLLHHHLHQPLHIIAEEMALSPFPIVLVLSVAL